MKRLITTSLVLTALVAAFAGQQFQPVLNGTTSTVGTNTTANFGNSVIFQVGNSATLALFLSDKSTDTNGTTQTIVIEKTLDGSTWRALETVQLVSNGTTAVSTNLLYASLTDTYQVRITSWANTNVTSLLTNVYAVGLTKLPSP